MNDQARWRKGVVSGILWVIIVGALGMALGISINNQNQKLAIAERDTKIAMLTEERALWRYAAEESLALVKRATTVAKEYQSIANATIAPATDQAAEVVEEIGERKEAKQ